MDRTLLLYQSRAGLEVKPGSRRSATVRDKVRRDPLHTVAKLSREAGISKYTGGQVMGDLNLRSRAQQKRLKLTTRDKRQCLQQCTQLLQRLCAGTGLRIFLDEAKIDLMPYQNSTKDQIIERVAGTLTIYHLIYPGLDGPHHD